MTIAAHTDSTATALTKGHMRTFKTRSPATGKVSGPCKKRPAEGKLPRDNIIFIRISKR